MRVCHGIVPAGDFGSWRLLSAVPADSTAELPVTQSYDENNGQASATRYLYPRLALECIMAVTGGWIRWDDGHDAELQVEVTHLTC